MIQRSNEIKGRGTNQTKRTDDNISRYSSGTHQRKPSYLGSEKIDTLKELNSGSQDGALRNKQSVSFNFTHFQYFEFRTSSRVRQVS